MTWWWACLAAFGLLVLGQIVVGAWRAVFPINESHSDGFFAMLGHFAVGLGTFLIGYAIWLALTT